MKVFFRRLCLFRVGLVGFPFSRASSFMVSSLPLSPALASAALAALPPVAVGSAWAVVGSVSLCPGSPVAFGLAARLSAAGVSLGVGAGPGVAAAVRAAAGPAVWRAALWAPQRAVVSWVSAFPFGGVFAFPGGPCPAGVPVGGAWPAVGLALRLGVPVVLFVPPGVPVAPFCGAPLSRFVVLGAGPWGAWLCAPGPRPLGGGFFNSLEGLMSQSVLANLQR